MFKNAAVELADIEQSLHGLKPFVIPNDFQAVAESVNIGVPIYDLAKKISGHKGVVAARRGIWTDVQSSKPKGLISRLRGAARQG